MCAQFSSLINEIGQLTVSPNMIGSQTTKQIKPLFQKGLFDSERNIQ